MSAPGIFRPPPPANEPIRTFAPGSPERESLQQRLEQMQQERIEIPCIIGGREVLTGRLRPATVPHDKEHVLADVHQGGAAEVEQAIAAAADAWQDWSRTPWEERVAILLRAAELLAGPWRDTLNAATMLGQSKTAHQAEIDAACETIDFFRFNASYLARIYEEQPVSSPGVWNRLEYRPLEGFVFAISPFNFTAIGANLTTSPALMGCTVVWKPASTAMLSAYYTMKLLEEAGLPPGVVNLVYGSGADIGAPALAPSRSRGRPLHRIHLGVPGHLARDRRQHRALPELPPDRRRDRRQGFRPRASVRGRRRGRDRDSPRRLRVPGSEVLGRLACLRPLQPLAGATRAARRGNGDDQGRRRCRLHELHGRRHRRELVAHPARGDRGGSRESRYRDRGRAGSSTTASATSSSRR